MMASRFITVLEKGLEHKAKVVLLHAFPFDRLMWQHQVVSLSSQAHTIAPDLPGFGESLVVGGKGSSLKYYVESIKNLLDERGINKAVFGGCSWGGYIIFELWRTYPSLVSGILLCDTRMESDAPEASAKRKHQIETLRTNGGNVHFLAEAMVPLVLSDKTYHARETDPKAKEIVEYATKTIQATSASTVENGLTAIMNRPDSSDTLHTINVPTLIIVGREDKGTPVNAAEAMKAKLPADTTRLEIIEDAGHLAPLEKPEEVSSKISKFLNDFKLV